MICKKCKSEITEGEKFCKNCGEKVEETQESINGVENIKVNNSESIITTNETKKKNNAPLIIVFVVLGIIIVGLIVFIIINLIPKDANSTNDDDKKPVVEEKPSTPTEDVISITNYDYKKVTGYDYALNNNKLYVKDNANNFVVKISNSSTLYSSVASKKSDIKEKLIASGYTINNAYVKTIGNIQYVGYDITSQGKNVLLFYAGHQDGSTVVGSLQVKSPYTYDEALEDISKIIKASSKSKNVNSDTSSESFDIDLSDITK